MEKFLLIILLLAIWIGAGYLIYNMLGDEIASFAKDAFTSVVGKVKRFLNN